MTEPMSMLERMAAVMWEARGQRNFRSRAPWESALPSDRELMLDMARAALEAMRYVTPRMVDAGNAMLADTHEICVWTLWGHMLDAALTEHRPREEGS